MNNLLLAEQSLPNFFSFLFQKARPGLFFVLVCFLATYGCSTPKYYRFQNKAIESVDVPDTRQVPPNETFVHLGIPGDIQMPASQPINELALTRTQPSAIEARPRKKTKKETIMAAAKDLGWDQLASTKKLTNDVTSTLRNSIDEDPPKKKNKAAKASLTMFLIAMLGVLGAMAIAPEFLIFLSLLVPSTIYGYIALSQIKKTGEAGKGKAIFTTLIGTGLILIALIFVIYLELEGGEW